VAGFDLYNMFVGIVGAIIVLNLYYAIFSSTYLLSSAHPDPEISATPP
jgi:hypothetical protein